MKKVRKLKNLNLNLGLEPEQDNNIRKLDVHMNTSYKYEDSDPVQVKLLDMYRYIEIRSREMYIEMFTEMM